MHAYCRAEPPSLLDVLELLNADLRGSSVRGSTPIARDPSSGALSIAIGRSDAPQAGHEHLQGAFDGYDLDACTRRSREGHLDAAMGLPLPLNACDDYARGYLSFNPDDGRRLVAGDDDARQAVVRQMHADGLLPERRRTVDSDAHRIASPGWQASIWILAAYVAGLATETIVALLRHVVAA